MGCEQARKIIEDAYKLKAVDDCIAKVIPIKHRQDFKQEFFLILLEKPCEEIERAFNKSPADLQYFIVRIILNLARWERGLYQTKYVDNKIEYDSDKTEKILYNSLAPSDFNTMEDRKERETMEEDFLNGLENLDLEMGNDEYPYHGSLVKLLIKYGSMRKVSRQTGIPLTSIHRTVKKVRGHINEKK